MFKPVYTIVKDHSTFYENDGFTVTLLLNNKHLETFCGDSHKNLITKAFNFSFEHAFEHKNYEYDIKVR